MWCLVFVLCLLCPPDESARGARKPLVREIGRRCVPARRQDVHISSKALETGGENIFVYRRRLGVVSPHLP